MSDIDDARILMRKMFDCAADLFDVMTTLSDDDVLQLEREGEELSEQKLNKKVGELDERLLRLKREE